MTTERMEPPDVRRGREMGSKKKVSEYQMDRYLLGLMSEAERLAFEMLLEMDASARSQFQRFEALWEAERFDARRHRMPTLPVDATPSRRIWGILRASVSVAVLGLVLWGSRMALWISTGTELRVQPYFDAGDPKAAKVSDAKKRVETDTKVGRSSIDAKKSGKKMKSPVATKKADGAMSSRHLMRTKGALDGADVLGGVKPALVVALLRGEQITQARSGQRFVTGDRLRLAHRWKRGGYVFWVHREGATVTPLYPREGKMESVAILSDEMILLPGSLEVSGAIKKEEWLVACFSRRPVSLGRLRAALVSLPKKMDRHASTLCDHVLPFFVRRE